MKNGEVVKSKSLIDAIEAASTDDLAEVRQQMAELQARIDSLKGVEKILAARFEPKAARGPRGPATGKYGHKQREKIAAYILHAGATKPDALAKQLGIAPDVIGARTQHPWFAVQPMGGIDLTAEGRRACG